MTAHDSKSYLSYLNKLVDHWYNNTYQTSIGKKFINADYSPLTNLQTNPEALKFKVNEWVRITKYNNIFS